MAAEITDIVRSLTLIMVEETERLRGADRGGVLAEMAAAKARLVGLLEARTAALSRQDPRWLEAMDADPRAELMVALADLKQASVPNAQMLERHIELSLEMIAAVAAEAKRLSLKAAPDAIRTLFFSTMTDRAGKLLREEMVAMGPVRSRDCEEAQSALVKLAKTLADNGEIMLVDPKSDDGLIY